jgi:hypothetical protein
MADETGNVQVVALAAELKRATTPRVRVGG